MNKEELKKTFKEYVEKYDLDDKMIELKLTHSYRVMDLANAIANHENFSENDIEISNIIGLLHDYARFPQWIKYHTYSDLKSIDHANLAVEILFDDEIKKYTTKKEDYDEIYDAIKYHNKLSIPNNLSQHNKLLTKVIRDADKLDIFYLYSIDKELIEEDEGVISTNVEEDFMSRKQIDRRDVNNKMDNIILNLSMVYDLNFDYSFRYLKDNKLIDKIFDNMENKKMLKKYFDIINEYIDERLNKKGND